MFKLLRWLVLAGLAGFALVVWISTGEAQVALRFANFTDQTVFITSVTADGKPKYQGPPAEQRPVKATYLAHGFTSFTAPREQVTLQFSIREASGTERRLSCVFDNTPGTCSVEVAYRGDNLSCFCDADRVS
jgi:hypothetical protein